MDEKRIKEMLEDCPLFRLMEHEDMLGVNSYVIKSDLIEWMKRWIEITTSTT